MGEFLVNSCVAECTK